MTTPIGSLLVAAFERAWSAIQERNPEVPDVVCITGGGLVATTAGIAVKWGHFGENHWTTADGAAHELFISGEALAREPHETMATLLHEAAHGLNMVRGENGTSRRNAYHNRTFVKAATELGLEWPEGKEKCKTRGFSEVEITEATREEYAETIATLKAESVAWRDLMGLTFGGDAGSDGDDAPGGDGGKVAGTAAKPRSKNTRPKAVCGCETDNTIYASRKTLDTKRPTCGVCGQAYEIDPEYV